MNNTFVKVVSTVLVAGVLVTFSGCTPKKVYSLNQDASKENVKVIMDARTDPEYLEKLEQDQEQNKSEFEKSCDALNASGDLNLYNKVINMYLSGEASFDELKKYADVFNDITEIRNRQGVYRFTNSREDSIFMEYPYFFYEGPSGERAGKGEPVYSFDIISDGRNVESKLMKIADYSRDASDEIEEGSILNGSDHQSYSNTFMYSSSPGFRTEYMEYMYGAANISHLFYKETFMIIPVSYSDSFDNQMNYKSDNKLFEKCQEIRGVVYNDDYSDEELVGKVFEVIKDLDECDQIIFIDATEMYLKQINKRSGIVYECSVDGKTLNGVRTAARTLSWSEVKKEVLGYLASSSKKIFEKSIPYADAEKLAEETNLENEKRYRNGEYNSSNYIPEIEEPAAAMNNDLFTQTKQAMYHTPISKGSKTALGYNAGRNRM